MTTIVFLQNIVQISGIVLSLNIDIRYLIVIFYNNSNDA